MKGWASISQSVTHIFISYSDVQFYWQKSRFEPEKVDEGTRNLCMGHLISLPLTSGEASHLNSPEEQKG